MSQKVSVKAKPTFFSKVDIPAPGGSFQIELEFKHRTRKEFDAFVQTITDRGTLARIRADIAVQSDKAKLADLQREEAEAKARLGDAPETVEEVDSVLELVCGWRGVEEAFSRDTLAEFLENFHAASRVIGASYTNLLTQARLGN